MEQVTAALEFPIISPSFCSTNPLDLNIDRKTFTTIRHGSFEVTDDNDNKVFKVRGSFLNVRDCRVLLDAAGCPIVTFQRKLVSLRQRWKLFRRESTKESDLVFSVRMSSCIQLKTELDVYLAGTTEDDAPDFKVEVGWFQGSCTVSAGKSSTVIAKMKKKSYINTLLLRKDDFSVTVTPGADYSFIVALIVILDQILETNKTLFQWFLL